MILLKDINITDDGTWSARFDDGGYISGSDIDQLKQTETGRYYLACSVRAEPVETVAKVQCDKCREVHSFDDGLTANERIDRLLSIGWVASHGFYLCPSCVAEIVKREWGTH